MPITTKFVISNPVHGEMYSIQHYVIKVVSDLRQVGGFFPSTPVSPTNKADRHDIAEILLKVALNTTSLYLMQTELTNILFIHIWENWCMWHSVYLIKLGQLPWDPRA